MTRIFIWNFKSLITRQNSKSNMKDPEAGGTKEIKETTNN